MRKDTLAARWGSSEFPSSPEQAPTRLIARHLPLFAVGWLGTTLAWGLTLVLEARLPVFPAMVLFVFQLGVLIAAIAICHAGGSTKRVPLVVLGACVLLGLSSTGLFAAIGGPGEMLAFILLTLYLASSPLFAWSGRAALVLIVSTLIPWVLAMPLLNFFLRPAELTAAISMGAVVCLLTIEAARRNYGVAQRALETSKRYRDLTDTAPDLIFTIDFDGRLTYVNETFARFVGEPAAGLLERGRYAHDFLTDSPANPDLHAVTARLLAGEEVEPQMYEMRSVLGVRWIETVFSTMRGLDGRVVRVRGSARDVTERHAAHQALLASLAELRRSEEDLRKLAQRQTPLAGAEVRLGFDPHGEGSEERASIALLRKPLSTLKDEEVRRLKEEVDRLRSEVQQQQAEVVNQVVEVPDDHPRRRRHPVVATEPAAGDAGESAGPAPFRFPERYRRKRKRSDDAS